VDVRCHPDVRRLNEALCSAHCGEKRCGCAVPDLEWNVIVGGFLCCRVKISVSVRCLFGVDVSSVWDVRLCDAVAVMDWRWTSEVRCQVAYLSWDLLSSLRINNQKECSALAT